MQINTNVLLMFIGSFSLAGAMYFLNAPWPTQKSSETARESHFS